MVLLIPLEWDVQEFEDALNAKLRAHPRLLVRPVEAPPGCIPGACRFARVGVPDTNIVYREIMARYIESDWVAMSSVKCVVQEHACLTISWTFLTRLA